MVTTRPPWVQRRPMRTYDLIADLPVRIDEYALEGLEQHVSSDFARRTTVIHLHGNGEAGHGEDVVWDSIDQERALQAGPHLPLIGDGTLRSFSEASGGARPVPARAAGGGRAALSLLGLRIRRAGPRAAPGGRRAAHDAWAPAAAAAFRRLRAPRRAATRPGPLPSRRRHVQRRLVRGSQAHPRDRRAAGAAPQPHHLGRELPLGRRPRGAPLGW